LKPKESRSLIHQESFKQQPRQTKIELLEKEDFLTLLKDFDNLEKDYLRFGYFCLLLQTFTDKDLWVNHIELIKGLVIHFTENYLSRATGSFNDFRERIVNLVNITRDKRLLDILFPVYLEAFDHFPINRYLKFRAFSILIHMTHMRRNTEILNEFILSIEVQFLKLLEELDELEEFDQSLALSELLMAFQGGLQIGLFRRHVTPIEVYPKYLIPIWDKHSTLIKKKYLSIISNFNLFSIDKNFNAYFTNIMGMSIEIGLMNEHFTIYLDVIEKLDEVELMRNFFDLIFLVEDIDILNENSARIERISISFLDKFDPILHKSPIGEVEPLLSDLYKNFSKVTKLFRIVGLRTKYLHRLESIFNSLLFYISRFRYYTTAILSLWSAIPNLNVEEKYIQVLLDTTKKFDFSLEAEILIFKKIMEAKKIWEKRYFPQIKTMFISLRYRSYSNDGDWYELSKILDRYPELDDIYEDWYSSFTGKEFKVNDFITLKLEEGNTNIYVNGEPFDQCKYLMLNIPIEDTKRFLSLSLTREIFEDIESIDEVVEKLGWTYDGQEGVEYDIDPETEFWGHCSNLQAWYEHNYDTRLLHSNLSFPLLKELVEAGDTVAKKVFKEEIVKRFKSGFYNDNLPIITYLFPEYFDYLEKNELLEIFGDPENFSYILKMFVEKYYYRLLTFEDLETIFDDLIIIVSEKTDIIEPFFSTFVEAVGELPRDSSNMLFSTLRSIAKKRGWEETYYPLLLKVAPDYNAFCQVVDYYDKTLQFSLFLEFINKRGGYGNFYILIRLIKTLTPPYQESYSHITLLILTKLLNEYFPKLWELLNNLRDPSEKYLIFNLLIKTSQGTALLKENFSQIKTLFLTLLNDFDKLRYIFREKSYSHIIEAIEGTDLENEPTFKTWKEKNSSRLDDLKT